MIVTHSAVRCLRLAGVLVIGLLAGCLHPTQEETDIIAQAKEKCPNLFPYPASDYLASHEEGGWKIRHKTYTNGYLLIDAAHPVTECHEVIGDLIETW
ncbi:MAG: hypothetical protein JO256_01185 [Alphaproteobacteria bacterium]|nr:hypothetical protein [Alphaproteobacteria bacterium]